MSRTARHVAAEVSCGRCIDCLRRDNSAAFEVLGYVNHAGGYAEFVKVGQNLIFIPDAIDYVQAACSADVQTAWHMLITCTAERGEDVLVLAAGSGVEAAIQIASWARGIRDRRVRRQARAFARAGGVEIIDHYREDVADGSSG